jgi:phospholipase C
MPPAGLDNLKHIVVLMMENRSFDHMLGGLMKKYPKINGLTGNESNPDTKGNTVKVQPNAQFQSQLDPDPDHHFPGVDLQIFGGQQGDGRVANMQGFVKDYFTQTNDVNRSHNIMYYFTPDKLPVLTTLATEFAVFNGWFSSIPGPTICNRAFAHYGTSFGQVGMDIFYILDKAIASIYERMIQAGHTAKIYYYDQQSSTMEIVNLLKNQPQIFATYDQFIADCKANTLPEYSFIEPCYNDHPGAGGGQILASDQHPDHNVREGERFIANTFNAIRTNQALWESTALLIVYDEHGGIYDHVVPPACTPDGYSAKAADTGTGMDFNFDRLGIRVPAVLVSPWIPRGTVVPGTEDPANAQIFEHASIPGTVTNFFLNGDAKRTVREQKAPGFLGLLTDTLRPDGDCVVFGNLS